MIYIYTQDIIGLTFVQFDKPEKITETSKELFGKVLEQKVEAFIADEDGNQIETEDETKDMLLNLYWLTFFQMMTQIEEIDFESFEPEELLGEYEIPSIEIGMQNDMAHDIVQKSSIEDIKKEVLSHLLREAPISSDMNVELGKLIEKYSELGEGQEGYTNIFTEFTEKISEKIESFDVTDDLFAQDVSEVGMTIQREVKAFISELTPEEFLVVQHEVKQAVTELIQTKDTDFLPEHQSLRMVFSTMQKLDADKSIEVQSQSVNEFGKKYLTEKELGNELNDPILEESTTFNNFFKGIIKNEDENQTITQLSQKDFSKVTRPVTHLNDSIDEGEKEVLEDFSNEKQLRAFSEMESVTVDTTEESTWSQVNQLQQVKNISDDKKLPENVQILSRAEWTEAIENILIEEIPAVRNGEQDFKAHFQLTPEHLGEVDVELVLSNQKLTAVFTVEESETKEWLKEQAGELIRQLAAQNVQLDDYQVVLSPDGSNLLNMSTGEHSFFNQKEQDFEKNQSNRQKRKHSKKEEVQETNNKPINQRVLNANSLNLWV